MSIFVVEAAVAALGSEGAEDVVPLDFAKGAAFLGPFGGPFVGAGESDERDGLAGPAGGGLEDGPRGGERVRMEDFGSRAGDRERER